MRMHMRTHICACICENTYAHAYAHYARTHATGSIPVRTLDTDKRQNLINKFDFQSILRNSPRGAAGGPRTCRQRGPPSHAEFRFLGCGFEVYNYRTVGLTLGSPRFVARAAHARACERALQREDIILISPQRSWGDIRIMAHELSMEGAIPPFQGGIATVMLTTCARARGQFADLSQSNLPIYPKAIFIARASACICEHICAYARRRQQPEGCPCQPDGLPEAPLGKGRSKRPIPQKRKFGVARWSALPTGTRPTCRATPSNFLRRSVVPRGR